MSALGSDPVKALANDFKDAPEQDRKQLRDQLYKVIRLVDDRYQRLQCPILREVLYPDGRTDVPHIVATVATQGSESAYVNARSRVNATNVDGVENLLGFDVRLGKVKTGDETSVLETNFKPLDPADLKPTFTVEDFSGGRKWISVFGYVLGLGIGDMGEGAARQRLTGYRPDTAIIDVPELRVVWLNDDANNRSAMESQAQSTAAAMLVESPNVTTIVTNGFLPCEIDGLVSEVRYSQAGYSTTIIVGGHACPSGGTRHHRRPRGGSGGHADRPSDNPVDQRSRTHTAAKDKAKARQHQRGGSFTRTPAAPASAVPATPTGFRPGFAKVGDTVTGAVGTFKGKSISGRVKRDASGEYDIENIGKVTEEVDVRLWPAGHKPLPLAKDQVVFCLFGPAGDSPSTPAPIGLVVMPSQFYMVKVYKDGGDAGNRTTASSFTYTVKTTDGVLFKEKVAVYKTRPTGLRKAAPDGSIGWAFYDGETLKLWDVNETDDTAGCTT